MKKILTTLSVLALTAGAVNAQVWINEYLGNPYGGDGGKEYFELRGTPNLSLSGYYLLSLEGNIGTSGTGAGDINQFFDLGAFSIGANGYLFARQASSPYTATAPGATVIENTIGASWGKVNGDGSSVGHYSDGTATQQIDLENGTITMMLINIGSGSAPTLNLDLDLDDDGLLDTLPSEWSIVDSVGIMDGSGSLATDMSYGAITLRSPDTTGNYAGGSAYGNIVDVPGIAPTTAGAFYVARKGESTGSTADDWFGAVLGKVVPLTFDYVSDPYYQGFTFEDMVFGGMNPVPEPGSLALLGLGGIALFLRRRTR